MGRFGGKSYLKDKGVEGIIILKLIFMSGMRKRGVDCCGSG
jgi:hypothetical protein